MSEKQELINYFKGQQEKFVYYIIALSVASIAFSAQITLDKKLSPSMIFLGVAVLFWIISVYTGLRFLVWVLASTYANIGMLEIIEGRDPTSGNHPEMIRIGVETIKGIMENNSKKTLWLGNIQEYSFYIGVLSFVVWRIIEMIPVVK